MNSSSERVWWLGRGGGSEKWFALKYIWKVEPIGPYYGFEVFEVVHRIKNGRVF